MNSTIDVDNCVEGGQPGTDDYDTGIVLDISDDGIKAYVGWDSGVKTWTSIVELRPL